MLKKTCKVLRKLFSLFLRFDIKYCIYCMFNFITFVSFKVFQYISHILTVDWPQLWPIRGFGKGSNIFYREDNVQYVNTVKSNAEFSQRFISTL